MPVSFKMFEENISVISYIFWGGGVRIYYTQYCQFSINVLQFDHSQILSYHS